MFRILFLLFIKFLCLSWSLFFVLYALLVIHLGTGPYALAGPSDPGRDAIIIPSYLIACFLVLGFTVAHFLSSKKWLAWGAYTANLYSFMYVFGSNIAYHP